MNYFKRRLYDYHGHQRMSLGSIPGGPTKRAIKLIAYHEAEMEKLAKPNQ